MINSIGTFKNDDCLKTQRMFYHCSISGCNESGYVPICRADDGSRYCINESRVCDGVEDCEDGADENNPMCPAGK